MNYGYNNENWGDLLTSIGNYTITYNSIGNPLTYMGMSLSWSDGRLLTGVGNNITYKYNQDGIRTEKNSSGWKIEYILNGTQIERERVYNTFGNLTYDKIYYYDANGIISSAIVYAADGDTYKAYYFSIRTNVQGDVLGVYNLDGNCLVSYTYDAWDMFQAIKIYWVIIFN